MVVASDEMSSTPRSKKKDPVVALESLQDRIKVAHNVQAQLLAEFDASLVSPQLKSSKKPQMTTAVSMTLIKCGFCDAKPVAVSEGRLNGLHSHWQNGCVSMKPLHHASDPSSKGQPRIDRIGVFAQKSLAPLFDSRHSFQDSSRAQSTGLGHPESRSTHGGTMRRDPAATTGAHTSMAAAAPTMEEDAANGEMRQSRGAAGPSNFHYVVQDAFLGNLTATSERLTVSVVPRANGARSGLSDRDLERTTLKGLRAAVRTFEQSEYSRYDDAKVSASHSALRYFLRSLSDEGIRVQVSLELNNELAALHDARRIPPNGFCFYNTLAALCCSADSDQEAKPFHLERPIDRQLFVATLRKFIAATTAEYNLVLKNPQAFVGGDVKPPSLTWYKEQIAQYEEVITQATVFTAGSVLPRHLWGGKDFWHSGSLSQAVQVLCWSTDGDGPLSSKKATASFTNFRGLATIVYRGMKPDDFYDLLSDRLTRHLFKYACMHYEIYYASQSELCAKYLKCAAKLLALCRGHFCNSSPRDASGSAVTQTSTQPL